MLMNHHQAVKTDIDALAENFTICVNLGKDLIQRRHPRSQEVFITVFCSKLLSCNTLVWKTWKCWGIWQLSGKCHGTDQRSQQTFNVLKHQETLTVRCTVRTCDQTDGLVLGLRLSTTRKTGTVPHDCTDNELVPGTTAHEAGRDRKQLTRLFVVQRTAVSRHRDGCRRRSTSSDDLTDDPTRLTTTTNSTDQRWRRRTTAECRRTTPLPWHGWRRHTPQHFQALTNGQQNSATRMTAAWLPWAIHRQRTDLQSTVDLATTKLSAD